MGVETERKFLVLRPPPALSSEHAFHIRQGYLSEDPTVRVRTWRCGDSCKAFLTVKGPGTLSRSEFEYEVPFEDGEAMLALCRLSLSKVRRVVVHAGLKWEVDEFQGALAGRWLAEVELESEGQVCLKPDWAGEEVSSDPRYANVRLARDGWPALSE